LERKNVIEKLVYKIIWHGFIYQNFNLLFKVRWRRVGYASHLLKQKPLEVKEMETAKSKAERHIASAYIIVILIFVLPASIGSISYHLENMATSTLPSNNPAVIQANTWAVYTPNGKAIPSTTTGTTATFFFPNNQTSAIIITRLTVGQAMNYTVTQISIIPSVNTAENIQFYFAIGSSYLNYTILYQIDTNLSLKNGTTVSSVPLKIPITPNYYSFPSDNRFIFLIKNASLGSEFSASVLLKGSTNSAVNVLLSPEVSLNISLIILGLSALVLGIFSIPWIELHTDRVLTYSRNKLKVMRRRRRR
jgi:hypothetical protein